MELPIRLMLSLDLRNSAKAILDESLSVKLEGDLGFANRLILDTVILLQISDGQKHVVERRLWIEPNLYFKHDVLVALHSEI